MGTEKVYTVEELAEELRVPVEAINKEIATGHLPAANVAGHIRIFESAVERAYKPGLNGSGHVNIVQSGMVLNVSKAPDFVHTWPGGIKEKFTDVREGTATYGGRSYHVRVGFTMRNSAGKERRRSLVIVAHYPTVEFVSAGTDGKGRMVSIIKDRAGKQLPVGAPIPPEYSNVPLGRYHEVVTGPGAPNGMAVICPPEDIETMVLHGLIRYRYREDRKKK